MDNRIDNQTNTSDLSALSAAIEREREYIHVLVARLAYDLTSMHLISEMKPLEGMINEYTRREYLAKVLQRGD